MHTSICTPVITPPSPPETAAWARARDIAPFPGLEVLAPLGNFSRLPDERVASAAVRHDAESGTLLVAEKDGRAVFAGCGSGGYRITTGVLHAFLYATEFGMGPQAAVDAPRIHCQGQETYVDGRIPQEVRDGLAAMGHKVVVQTESPGLNAFGRVNAITVATDGSMRAGSGPAWASAAAAC